MFNGAAYHPGTGALYVGMADHCAWYLKGSVIKDWAAAVKFQAPKGWITAMDGQTGAVLWRYHTDSQALAGLVPTKSGLLFGGDTHGNLLVLDATNGNLLKRIDAGGALNSGLISYSVRGEQYVAAAVGGATENPSTVAGPLRVVIYGLWGPDQPEVVTLDRFPPIVPGFSAGEVLYTQNCRQCHGPAGAGSSAPPFLRQSQLADPELLKQFLATVPPPMPRLYPGVLTENEVEMLANYLATAVFQCGPNEPQSCEPPGQPVSGGTEAWRAIYAVLTSPRCINCHPVVSNLPPAGPYPQDYPRQGDDRHPHYFTVLRGDTFAFETPEHTGVVFPGMGAPVLRCTFCHGNKNDPATGIPGTFDPLHPGPDPANPEPHWFLAPAIMAWESAPGVPMTGAELCAQLKDPARNGGRDLEALLHHNETEPLVLWGWSPGIRPNGEPRTTPPISHEAFVQAFKQWMAEGAPCPEQ